MYTYTMKNSNFRVVRAIFGLSIICVVIGFDSDQANAPTAPNIFYNPQTVPPPPACDGTLKSQPAENLLIEIFFDPPIGVIIQQMCSSVADFGQRVQVQLYAGAGSEINADNLIDCVSTDCTDDLEFACASQYPDIYIDYVCCRAGNRSGPQCCTKLGIDWSSIQNCMTTDAPINIINENRQRRINYRIKQGEITSVVYNQFHDPCTDYSTLDAFFDTTCSLLNPPPKFCFPQPNYTQLAN